MSVDYNRLSKDAIEEARKFSISDPFMFGNHYFSCGFSYNSYYNHAYAVAIAIIGKIYGSDDGNNSDYHKGIAYVAKKLGISKRQVKSPRKKHKVHKGYEFKTPYGIPDIIEKIIMLLQEQENNALVQELVDTYNEVLYRRLLVGVQYDAIKIAARRGREKVLEVEGRLDHLTQTFGG